MPLNGAGSYTPPAPEFPAISGTLIEAAKFNAIINDMASALSLALYRDGQVPFSANQSMGNSRLTNVGAPVGGQDAINLTYLVNYVTSQIALGSVYLGSFTTNPTERPDGTALQPGDIYLNISNPLMPYFRAFSGTVWVEGIPGDAATINYTPAGTGAVATTVDKDLDNQVVNAFRFLTVAEILSVQAGNLLFNVTSKLQQAIDSGVKALRLPAGGYLIDFLEVPSEFQLFGDGADLTLIWSTFDGPILVSKNYFSANAVAPSGDVYIHDLSVVGDATGVNQKGILLRDYYSLIERVNLFNTLSASIEFDHLDDVGTPAGGTLVNNRIRTIRTSGTGPMFLGVDGNGKLTDGVVDDVILSIHAASPYALYIGQAAGWFIDKVHTEGNTATENSVRIIGGFHTHIGSIYCETGGVSGKPVVVLTKTQKKVFVGSLSIRMSAAGAIGLFVDRSGLVANAQVSISQFYIQNTGVNAVTGISVNSATAQLQIASKIYDTEAGGTITDSYTSAMLSRWDSSQQTGLWTPTVVGGSTPGTYTLSDVTAHYVRTGNFVQVFAQFSFSAASGGTGVLTIGGLPFAYSANTAAHGHISASNLNTTGATPSLGLIRATAAADSRVLVAETTDAAALVATPIGAVGLTTTMYISFSYFTEAT